MASMPSNLSKLITNFAKDRISEENLAEDGYEDYCHCTILYGFGQDVTSDEVFKFVYHNDISELGLTLGKINRFKADDNRPDSDVIKIEITDCKDLKRLNSKLKTEFSVVSNYKGYHPHITLAYVKPGSHPELDGDDTFDGIELTTNVVTYSSGPSEDRKRDTLRL